MSVVTLVSWKSRSNRRLIISLVVVITVEIDGPGAVAVDLADDAGELLVGELGVQLVQDLLEGGGGDVAVALLVVDPERLPQLLLHAFLVLLDQELGALKKVTFPRVHKWHWDFKMRLSESFLHNL